MPARTEEWHLLELDRDPVPSTPSDIDPVIAHYKTVTLALENQAVLMRRLGDGDDAGLKGEYVDAMRERAKESAETLAKAAARYRNLFGALDEYRGALEIARSESQEAIDAATAANSERVSAENSADPVNEPRDEDDPKLDADEIRASEDRSAAIGKASGALQDAIATMRRAQAAFDSAAHTAAARIRKDWDIDGLSNTLDSVVRFGAVVFLKALVEVLGYIGMALAVIGLVFTGVGWILIAGAVIAVVSLVASIALSVMGEANLLNVILGAIGLVTLGLGVLVARFARITGKAALAAGREKLSVEVAKLTKKLNTLEFLGAAGPVVRVNSVPIVNTVVRPVISRFNTVPPVGGGRVAVPPRPTGPPPPGSLSMADKIRIDDLGAVVTLGAKPPPSAWAATWIPNVQGLRHLRNWSPGAALGIDDAVAAAAISTKVWNLFGPGSATVPLWMYFGAVANVYGFASGIFGAAHAPSDLADFAGADDYRSDWGITEYLEEKLTPPSKLGFFDFPAPAGAS